LDKSYALYLRDVLPTLMLLQTSCYLVSFKK